MILYVLYRIGCWIAIVLPVKISYFLACMLADICCLFFPRDREAICDNLLVVLGPSISDEELRGMPRKVFRNFAKYLVDFFRFSLIDTGFLQKHVKIENIENVDRGRAPGKGVIMLSAHMGNWELGGFVLSLVRYPLSAVVLTHSNKRINDFFRKQRSISNMEPVEIGAALRGCYRMLKSNGLVALLGDRDFSNNGIPIEFFGKTTTIPKGPAVLSYRIGSAIVPIFMLREYDDTFRLVCEEPIFPDLSMDEDTAVKSLAKAYTSVIERYVRKYPAQWYMFRKVWNNHEKSVRTDTII